MLTLEGRGGAEVESNWLGEGKWDTTYVVLQTPAGLSWDDRFQKANRSPLGRHRIPSVKGVSNVTGFWRTEMDGKLSLTIY